MQKIIVISFEKLNRNQSTNTILLTNGKRWKVSLVELIFKICKLNKFKLTID